jgi:hypothetical protein
MKGASEKPEGLTRVWSKLAAKGKTGVVLSLAGASIC